ncbi:PAS domain-containing sensor histidine kinase [Humidesulfovibrio mexicanus]|nr:PAS domain S-box protein [Humidesulfovibrio mexicanus]
MSKGSIHQRRRLCKPRARTFTRRDARLRMLAENSSDVYFSVRLPGARYEYISPSVEALCGFSPEAFYRDAGTFLRCVAPAWREQMAVWLAEIDRGQVAEAYEFQVIGPDGSLRWVRQRQIRGATPDGAAWLLQGVATDITELRQAQTELRESKEHFRQLIELWPDQVALSVNLDAGRHEYVSPSMERMLGYTPQEFYDDPDLARRVVPPHWRDKARRWFAEIRSGTLQPFYELELAHKHGGQRWIHLSGVLRPRAPGQDMVAQFILRDVTSRKRAEAALRESETRFRDLAENWTDQVIVRINLRTHRHEYVSPGMTRIFGYRPEEFYAETSRALDAVLPEWRPQRARWLEEMSRGVIRPEYEFEVLDAWGNRRWVLQRGSILRDAKGRPAALQAVLCDNTERRRLEDALRESNRRYALLAENMVDVIWALDAHLRWTYLSPSAEALAGESVDALLQRPLDSVLSKESIGTIGRTIEQWGRAAPGSPEDEPQLLTLEVIHVGGRAVPVEALARCLRDASGRITGYCGTARDIRPRRRMERVEAALGRLSLLLLECADLAQVQVLASACAEDITGAGQVLAQRRDPETGRYLSPSGSPCRELAQDNAVSVPVLHAGEELGRLVALDLEAEQRPRAALLLERVAALLSLAVARILAEEALRKSERTSRKLLESMHEGVWAVDRENRTIFVNEYLTKMLGYGAEELAAMRPWEVLDSAELPRALSRLRERRLGLSGTGDYDLRRRDGGVLPVQVSSSPILNESGGYEGLVCTALDLSERKRMEAELRRNQARFEALYELTSLDGVGEAEMAAFALREALRLTASGGGALFFVSADGQQLTPLAWHGVPDPLGPLPAGTHTPWAVVHATGVPLVLNDFTMSANGSPEGYMGLDRFLGVPALDGERPAAVLALMGKAAPYTPDDTLQVSLLMDGMWRIVRGRRDDERIRASLREKDALLREVQHRVKNNLQVVTSLLDMAVRRMEDPQARLSLSEVRAKVQAMSLVHAQLHSGAAEGAGAGRGIDLERYVRALVRQLREVYSGDMSFEARVELEGLSLGLDQAVPLGLALNEALANAFKHGRQGEARGRVVLDACREADGRVRIELKDHGPGLPAGLEPEHASGLGLKLMFGLVRHQLGGQLDLESGPEGVVVRIRFCPSVAR